MKTKSRITRGVTKGAEEERMELVVAAVWAPAMVVVVVVDAIGRSSLGRWIE